MIKEVAENLTFPREAIEELDRYFQLLRTDDNLISPLDKAKEIYFAGKQDYVPLLDQLSEKSGIRRESTDMIFLLYCAQDLRMLYRQKGYTEALYWESLQDLRYKLTECKATYGCWGTFVMPWFHRFYLCERFKLGRLQYERIAFPYHAYKGVLKKGETVYNCHIPACGSLLKEEVLDSLKKAYAFFRGELANGLLPVVCDSWLLYEPMKTVFPTNTNIGQFRALFDVMENVKNENNDDFWRVFNIPYSAEVLKSVLPQTGLQTRLKEYLENGNSMGNGFGILLFDGDKILKK